MKQGTIQRHSLPKLVASDIGGTLLRGGSVLPDFTASVLNRLVNDGIPVALITGYNYRTTMRFTRNLDEKVILLPQNGTLCIKQQQLVWEFRIPQTAVEEIYRHLESNSLPVILYKGKNENFSNFYVYHEEVPALEYAFKRLDRLDSFENITGISTLLPEEMALQVREKIETIVGAAFKVIYTRESKGSWLEVVHTDVRKDLALERLCTELQVPLKDVIYFGDNFNDREVLRMVGQPVLVDNAYPELKREFDTVVPSVYDEGVAHYLNKLFALRLETIKKQQLRKK
jgi:Cof subfamily protein (haloacid dehalogenase superfamily)